MTTPTSAAVKGTIAVIDDEKEMRGLLHEVLTREGYRVIQFPLAIEALRAFIDGGRFALGAPEADAVDVIISDIKMAQLDGMQFLKEMGKHRPEIPVILITAFGSIDTAIEAMKNGAHHYLVKPFKLTEMSVVVEKAMEKRRLQRDNQILRAQVKKQYSLGDVVGKSPVMAAVFDLVRRVAGSTANVLITGESGTGKEMVARAIHASGPRGAKPFIAINCTAIPESLLESELFGHAKGSFTGAIARKKGLFEEGNGGTIFLDEIGDMSPPLQAKLLRVIQERKVRPVGDNAMIDVDVRIIAATHKDLKAAIREGCFREDLYYRLSVIPISIPPLRQRASDIPLLAQHFLRKYAAANGARVTGFTPAAIEKLMAMRWEGNVRELENAIERAVVLASASLIDTQDIDSPEVKDADQFFRRSSDDWPTVAQLEERYVRGVLEKTAGRKDKAAQILGINRRTLYRKEREYGMVSAHVTEEDAIREDPDSEDGS